MDYEDLRNAIKGTLIAQHPGDTDKRAWNSDVGIWLRPGDFVFETEQVDRHRLVGEAVDKNGRYSLTPEQWKKVDAVKPARFVVNLKKL